MRRETWEFVGGFDDGFFLWYEDVDLAKRLHDQGHRNLVVGSARVGHAGASSFVQIDRPLLESDAACLGGAIHRQAPLAALDLLAAAVRPLEAPQSDGPDDAEPSPEAPGG